MIVLVAVRIVLCSVLHLAKSIPGIQLRTARRAEEIVDPSYPPKI